MKTKIYTPLFAIMLGAIGFLSIPSSSEAYDSRRNAGPCNVCGEPVYSYLQVSVGPQGPRFSWVTDYHSHHGTRYYYHRDGDWDRDHRYWRYRDHRDWDDRHDDDDDDDDRRHWRRHRDRDDDDDD